MFDELSRDGMLLVIFVECTVLLLMHLEGISKEKKKIRKLEEKIKNEEAKKSIEKNLGTISKLESDEELVLMSYKENSRDGFWNC